MPKYKYHCKKCDDTFIVHHKMALEPETCGELPEDRECDGDGEIKRCIGRISTDKEGKLDSGYRHVKRQVEETRKNVKEHKESQKGRMYDPNEEE